MFSDDVCIMNLLFGQEFAQMLERKKFGTFLSQAYEMGLDTVEGVVSEGPGLVFVVFPQALSNLPLPQIWSVIFFAMLVMLGVDSQGLQRLRN